MKFALEPWVDTPRTKSGAIDEGLNITLRDFTRAERLHRQIIQAMNTCETAAEVESYFDGEARILDALATDQPELHAAVEEVFTEIRDRLAYCEARAADIPAPTGIGERPANNGNSAISNSKETNMFKIATVAGGGGSQGPWISWSSNGSAMKAIAPKSWVLREKEEGAIEATSTAIPAFANGCVMDLESLKLGWEKDVGTGQAPERRWSPDIAMPMPRPDDSKKATGGFAWSAALSVRCAIGGGKAATWEQGAFGAYEGFSRLARQIEAQYPGDGTLPLVKQTGVETIKLKSGAANIPILAIERWVPRPDCLKADAPTIATAPAPAPQPAPQPQTSSVPDDAAF